MSTAVLNKKYIQHLIGMLRDTSLAHASPTESDASAEDYAALPPDSQTIARMVLPWASRFLDDVAAKLKEKSTLTKAEFRACWEEVLKEEMVAYLRETPDAKRAHNETTIMAMEPKLVASYRTEAQRISPGSKELPAFGISLFDSLEGSWGSLVDGFDFLASEQRKESPPNRFKKRE